MLEFGSRNAEVGSGKMEGAKQLSVLADSSKLKADSSKSVDRIDFKKATSTIVLIKTV